MAYLIDTNVVIYYFNGLTQEEQLHEIVTKSFPIHNAGALLLGVQRRALERWKLNQFIRRTDQSADTL